jgi:hypothetical protein
LVCDRANDLCVSIVDSLDSLVPVSKLCVLSAQVRLQFLPSPGFYIPDVNPLRQGCLSSAPTRVSFASSLWTLELYRRAAMSMARHPSAQLVRGTD